MSDLCVPLTVLDRYYSLEAYQELTGAFTLVQNQIEINSNSNYWLVYASPLRNEEEHVLEISIPLNQNQGVGNILETEFCSDGFSTVVPGVYLNRSFVALNGISEAVFSGEGQTQIIEAETLFPLTCTHLCVVC